MNHVGSGRSFLLENTNENFEAAVQAWAVEHFRLSAQAWNKLRHHSTAFDAAGEGRRSHGKAEWENAVLSFYKNGEGTRRYEVAGRVGVLTRILPSPWGAYGHMKYFRYT